MSAGQIVDEGDLSAARDTGELRAGRDGKGHPGGGGAEAAFCSRGK